MTITEAINKSRADVRLVSFDRQWVLHTWSARHNATWQSHPMQWDSAKNALRSSHIEYALEQLGWEHEDAVYESMKDEEYTGYRRPRWEQVVRSAAQKGCTIKPEDVK